MANCWLNRTNLETGLILILTVATIFLLIMIGFYIFFAVSKKDKPDEKIIHCENACASLEKYCKVVWGPKEKSVVRRKDHTMSTDKEKRSLKNNTQKWDNSPIGALIRKLYLDDDQQFEFLSAVAVLSPKWILSPYQYKDKHTSSIFIRIASRFWSKGGYIYDVHDVHILDEAFTIIELKLNIDIPITFLKLGNNDHVDNIQAYGWRNDLKYGELDAVNLNPVDFHNCSELSNVSFIGQLFCAISNPIRNIDHNILMVKDALVGIVRASRCNTQNCLFICEKLGRRLDLMTFIV